jgi:tripartite ATP-independent transporter DctP family solute receptor
MAIRVTRRAALAGVSVFAITARARAATVIRWSDAMAVTHPEVSLMYKVAADMKEQTGGAVDIQVFPGGQLGSTADTVAAVSLGATQMVSEGPGAFSQFVVPFSILEAPYLWRDVAHLHRAMAAPLMDGMINQLIRERDMRMIGSTYYGTRHLTSGARPVHSVADMKGFKLRVPEVDTYRAMAELWGARPTPLNIGELYMALSQGAVDGEENPLPTIQSSKFNEVQKYLVLTAHIISPRMIVINENTWKSLDTKQQGLLRESIAKRAIEQNDAIINQEKGLAESFAKGGMTVIEPDIDSFRKPVIDAMPRLFEAKWGKSLWEKVISA